MKDKRFEEQLVKSKTKMFKWKILGFHLFGPWLITMSGKNTDSKSFPKFVIVESEPEQSKQQETHKSILVDIQTNQIEAAFLVEKHYGETDEYLHLWVKMSDSQAGLEARTPTRIPNKVPRYYTISEGNFSKLVSPIKEQMLRSQAEKKSEGYSGRLL